MRPSATKSSPSSGSITLVSASWTSSTVGIDYRVVGSSGYAGLGAHSRLHRGSDRGALPDLPRRRRDRRIAYAPPPGRRFAAGLGTASHAGALGLESVQRGHCSRKGASQGGDGWCARDLRRRLPDHSGLHHRCSWTRPPHSAHEIGGPAQGRTPARASRRSRSSAAAVSGEAFALSFFDPDRELYGIARSGSTILFEGRSPAAHAAGPEVGTEGEAWRAELPGTLSLLLEPVTPELELGGVGARVCRVSGEAAGREVSCLGTFSVTRVTPRWDELDALRSLSALVDDGNALLALARRPRGASGHGQELVRAGLFVDGELRQVEEARISTVYDGDGRQRSAGLELWLPGEEFPRRGSGVAIAGSSLELDPVRVHAAVFRWRLDGREGIGAYELMVRVEPPAAA